MRRGRGKAKGGFCNCLDRGTYSGTPPPCTHIHAPMHPHDAHMLFQGFAASAALTLAHRLIGAWDCTTLASLFTCLRRLRDRSGPARRHMRIFFANAGGKRSWYDGACCSHYNHHYSSSQCPNPVFWQLVCCLLLHRQLDVRQFDSSRAILNRCALQMLQGLRFHVDSTSELQLFEGLQLKLSLTAIVCRRKKCSF